jgi:hypothetical protein
MRNFLLSRPRAALSLAPALLAACSVYDPALVQPRDAGPPDMPVVRRDASDDGRFG